MLRCAVSIASATPRPHDQTWWRNARVASQSMSAGAPGTFSRGRPAARRARRRRRRGCAAARSGGGRRARRTAPSGPARPLASTAVDGASPARRRRGGRSARRRAPARAAVSSGRSTRAPVRELSSPASASRTPRAPARKSNSCGASSTTWRRNCSHWVLNPFSNSSLSGTSIQSVGVVVGRRRGRGSRPASGWRCGAGSGSRTGPATALPWVPSTWNSTQLLAVDPHGPAGVELRDHAAVQLEDPRRRRRRRWPGRARPPRRRGWGCA